MANLKPKRSASRQCEDLAWMIQIPPRRQTVKLVLTFLAKKANDSLRTWHGYDSIKASTGIRQDHAVSDALKYLRDELQILTWRSGKGGRDSGDTNRYQFNLKPMRELVRTQGVFDPETGRIIRTTALRAEVQDTTTALKEVVNVFPERKNDFLKGNNDCSQGRLTPNEATPNKSNSQRPGPEVFEGEKEQTNSPTDINKSDTVRPPVAAIQPFRKIDAEILKDRERLTVSMAGKPVVSQAEYNAIVRASSGRAE